MESRGRESRAGEPRGSRRRYQSPGRAEQARRTPARICAAATAQFLAARRRRGPRTIGAGAAAAGVSVPTVEAAFGTKARLLKAAIDVATAGDDAPVAMLDRSWAAAAEATPDPEGFVIGFAGVVLAALDAAAQDPEIGAVAAQLAGQREVMAAWLVDGLRQRAALRDGL